MPWITLTDEMVRSRLSGLEIEHLEDIRGAGATDPVPDIIADVVQEVRGHVATSGAALDSGATIPAKLKNAALVLIRNRVITQLPDLGLLDDARRDEGRGAERLLERVADGKFAVDLPDTPITDEASGGDGGIEVVRSETPRFSRTSMDGL